MSTNAEKAHIAIVEDDRDLSTLLKFNFENSGLYKVSTHLEGLNAFSFIESAKPDLIVLDVMLPGKYGTEILSELRSHASTRDIPVILLTARADEEDRITGLEAGADDYVTKPFSPKELLLRVHGLLRRSRNWGQSQSKNQIAVGPLILFPSELSASLSGETLVLTQTEFQLLLFLAENVGRLQNRDVLLNRVWGYEGNVNTRTVDTHVKRLRQKLGAAGAMIETVHGLGYRLTAEVP